MKILVIAEHDGTMLKSATRNAVTAAAKIGGEIHLLVAGTGCSGVAETASRISGVSRVLYSDAQHYGDPSAENMAALVLSCAASYDCLLAPATTAGKNLMPRIAAGLDVAQISEVVAVDSPDTFVCPIYAGNVLATVSSSDAVKVITVRVTSFEAAADVTSGDSAVIETLAALPDLQQSKVVSRQLTQSARPDLADAHVVVAGGRGLGSAEKFRALLEPLGDRLGAALGASRAAVDAGYVSNDLQVGQTGRIVAPQLYIAVGISGAIQHLAGMKESRVIVAINKDPDAPIFQVADYAIVGDLFEVVPALTAQLG